MAQRKTLNERQVVVLRWIGEGCPDGVMEGVSHRITAAALRTRGLVRIAGRGPSWEASITRAGLDYLARVDSPDPPRPRQPNVSVTQQLVDDLVAAGGTLRVPRRHWQERGVVDYEYRARLAERYGKVPVGKRLTVRQVSWSEFELALVDAPDRVGGRAVPVVVEVPARVGRYHRAAREFRARTDRHEISRTLLGRAARIIHAIATEAERRGWEAETPPGPAARDGRLGQTAATDGHLKLTAGGHEFWLRLREEGVHTRGPWEAEVHRYRNVSSDWSFSRARELPRGPYDAAATGQLRLELHTTGRWDYAGRQSRWADRNSWALEQRLGHVFAELEERIVEADYQAEQQRIAAEQAAEAARQAAQERERRWHQLMDEARHRLVEADRAKRLHAQATAWETAERLRRYCEAVEAAHRGRAETEEWLAWARAYISATDPLTRPPVMPDPPEPTAEALQPFLPDGWSARGPEDWHHRR